MCPKVPRGLTRRHRVAHASSSLSLLLSPHSTRPASRPAVELEILPAKHTLVLLLALHARSSALLLSSETLHSLRRAACSDWRSPDAPRPAGFFVIPGDHSDTFRHPALRAHISGQRTSCPLSSTHSLGSLPTRHQSRRAASIPSPSDHASRCSAFIPLSVLSVSAPQSPYHLSLRSLCRLSILPGAICARGLFIPGALRVGGPINPGAICAGGPIIPNAICVGCSIIPGAIQCRRLRYPWRYSASVASLSPALFSFGGPIIPGAFCVSGPIIPGAIQRRWLFDPWRYSASAAPLSLAHSASVAPLSLALFSVGGSLIPSAIQRRRPHHPWRILRQWPHYPWRYSASVAL
jgi:hypothetical protein